MNMYEVQVKVRCSPKPKGYNSSMGIFVYEELIKMFHKEARTPQQALDKCKKYGRPISVQKADISDMVDDIEKILDNPRNPYPNAIAMGEMIWKRKHGSKDKG